GEALKQVPQPQVENGSVLETASHPPSPQPVPSQNPPKTGPARPAALEALGGAVPLDSEFYITRPADGDLKSAICKRDSIVLIKGARQMGKTSLLARGMQIAREQGHIAAAT